ncbi:MAG: response regulator transcription factor [Chloroflexi bacterium]|nr:response regulator transcription factor [Chloroflexota bacterium]
MSKLILVVDDEKRLRDLVSAYLTEAGFQVVTACDGREAMFRARDAKPDLIVLDLMMPEMDGYQFLKQHRQERNTPIIVLTARVQENERVIGLEFGADDYVCKPFSPRELTARIRAVLRRVEDKQRTDDMLRASDITLDLDRRQCTVGANSVTLTPSEFDLLAALMSAPGRPFTRYDLLERLNQALSDTGERVIDTHIKNLRAKIEPNPSEPAYIETVYGVGYRFRG